MPLFIIFLVLTAVSIYLARNNNFLKKENKDLSKYRPLLHIDKELNNRKNELDYIEKSISKSSSNLKEIREYIELFSVEKDLIETASHYPKYNLLDSEKYKTKLEQIKSSQKQLIKDKRDIVLIGSLSESVNHILFQKITKLALTSFNVQCDNIILKVNSKNIETSEKKIEKIYNSINQSLSHTNAEISEQLFWLKQQELYLNYEYEHKKQEEKEEQRALKAQIREEQKVLREIERAQQKAEQEEIEYEHLLAESKKQLELEMAEKTDKEKNNLMSKIKELELKLEEAHTKKEKALSMAQQTKRGHVYVISNIGSFGDNLYKIGMTRRLEPVDRVKELGDASVPFPFDIHAMIFSENAPDLEKSLHNTFNDRRVNKINTRKEFFHVTLEEIEKHCTSLGLKMKFTKLAEATEWRETLMLNKKEKDDKAA